LGIVNIGVIDNFGGIIDNGVTLDMQGVAVDLYGGAIGTQFVDGAIGTTIEACGESATLGIFIIGGAIVQTPDT